MVTAGDPAVIIQKHVARNQSTLTPGDIEINRRAGQERMIHKQPENNDENGLVRPYLAIITLNVTE